MLYQFVNTFVLDYHSKCVLATKSFSSHLAVADWLVWTANDGPEDVRINESWLQVAISINANNFNR